MVFKTHSWSQHLLFRIFVGFGEDSINFHARVLGSVVNFKLSHVEIDLKPFFELKLPAAHLPLALSVISYGLCYLHAFYYKIQCQISKIFRVEL